MNPNSYDVRLGHFVLHYAEQVLDVRRDNPTLRMNLSEDGTILKSGKVYLGFSEEVVGSRKFVPMLHAKSGIARLGLFVHATADLVDLGFFGNITLQLIPTLDIKVFPGMKVAQISFWKCFGDITPYDGKYQGARGPQSSKSFMDV